MKIIRHVVICAAVILVHLGVNAQSLPVGNVAVEDYYRRAQLLHGTDSAVSFTVRPLFPNLMNRGNTPFYPDSLNGYRPTLGSRLITSTKNLNVSLLPLSFQSQFNSDHPYGWNDGAMIPAKGLQTLMSAGIYLQYGPLSIQLKPEFVMAENASFETFNKNHYDVIFARYYDIYNNVDLPVRFGTGSYVKPFWGQSSIRLNYKALSFGLSTENLWWGPGIRNSLLMSNTAPGFAHLTLNTSRPIQTAIGSFEGQIIAGRLENSGYPPLEPDHISFGTDLYVPKQNDWRYLAGIVLTWQPKWVPGLFLGFDQASQNYGKNLSGITDYLPLFSPIKNVSGPDNAINTQNQVSSLFMRWVWPKAKAELYFEWGHYNYTGDLTQALLSPNDSRAYVFGFRKFLPFNGSRDENILIGAEVTQLQENSIPKIEQGAEWYVSNNIRQGYTNLGEALGAGIGPGANLQTLDVSWVKGLKKIGLQFERYVHNNDFYYYAFEDSGDFRRHWVDLSMAATGEWNYKNLIFNLKIQAIQSINYQWYLRQNPGDPYFVNGAGAFNVQVQAGVSYRF